MNEELKRLQKEINGKVVVWNGERSWGEGFKFDAICLWEPGGTIVSIKPYGVAPDDYIAKANSEDIESILNDTAEQAFCFATLSIKSIDALEKLALLPSGGEFNFNIIAATDGGTGSPTCPYSG